MDEIDHDGIDRGMFLKTIDVHPKISIMIDVVVIASVLVWLGVWFLGDNSAKHAASIVSTADASVPDTAAQIERVDYRRMMASHEGVKDRYYYDSNGNLIVGIGHLAAFGKAIPQAAVDIIFQHDLEAARDDVDAAIEAYDLSLDPVREAAMVNMAFQGGRGLLLSFVTFLRAMHDGRWDDAAKAYEGTKMAKRDTHRARREEIASMIRTGKTKYIAQ